MIRFSSTIPRLVFVFLVGGLAALFFGTHTSASQDAAKKTPVEAPPSTVTQATMRGIFTALTESYKYSLDMNYFQDRHNRDTVLASLEALVANTSALENHGGGLDPSFDYLRRFLAEDAKEALERYNDRQYLGAQFMLTKLMENCATCHSRLPSSGTFATGAEFLKAANVESIAPVDRVNIEIAARQFDKALSTYEEIFELPNMTAQGLRLIGAFEGYLKIAIAVKNDTKRPALALEKYLRRGDVPPELREDVQAWIRDLATLNLAADEASPVESARRLVGDATVARKPPSPRPDLVRMIAANTILHRYLQALSPGESVASEIYYLLAVTESRVTKSFWISETDYLLEKAVRSAPKSEYGRKAFAVLVDRSTGTQPVSAYEGMPEQKIDIEALRKLVEG
jgi:hypothetical protein